MLQDDAVLGQGRAGPGAGHLSSWLVRPGTGGLMAVPQLRLGTAAALTTCELK